MSIENYKMIRKFIYILSLLFFSISVSAQETEAEKLFRISNHKSSIPIEKAKNKNPEDVQGLYVRNYTDTVFPNKEILKYKNIEHLNIIGKWQLYKKDTINQKFPISLKIDVELLKQFPKLKFLTLSYFDLSDFPEEIYKLDKLTLLRLDLCNIDSLPLGITKMRSLEVLSLRLNNIKKLPKDIADLNKLLILDFNNNSFTTIPQEILKMNSIKKISFGNIETQKEAAPTKYFPFYSHLNKIDYIKEMDVIKEVLSKEHVNFFYIHLPTCEDKKNVYRILSNKELSAKMGVKKKLPCKLYSK